MINLSIYNDDVEDSGTLIPVFEFSSIYRINIIGGDSGTGKTRMFNCLEMALINQDGWSVQCNKPIVLINNVINIADQLKQSTETIFICDEDITHLLLKMNLSALVNKSKNYFIFIDRSLESFIDTNAKAIFQLNQTKRVYSGIEIMNIKQYIELGNTNSNGDIQACDYKYLVLEDTKSGKTFMESMLDKLNVFGESSGRSVVPENLKGALRSSDKKVLIAMDYDTSSSEMLKIFKDDSIDKDRISFIAMESFEELLCNSKFLLEAFPEMEDEVINYAKYIDASSEHTGRYFSNLLFKYVKVKSPLKANGSKNATKFYSKGMQNFKECFLDDCCHYNEANCKLYVSTNKKKLMLCNKFACLRVFSSAYDN